MLRPRFKGKCLAALLSVLLLLGGQLHAQIVSHGNAFLRLGTRAGSEAIARTDIASRYTLGMGRCNAASLSGMHERFSAGGTFLSQFGNMGNLGYLAFGMGLDSMSGFEVSLLRFGVDDIPNTLNWIDSEGNIDYNRISYFSVADYALHLSYGRQIITQGMSIGATVKAIYRHEGEFAKGVGVGLDVGMRYQFRQWEFAAVLRDATTTWTLWFMDREALRVHGPAGVDNPTAEKDTEGMLPSISLGGGYTWKSNSQWTTGLNLLCTLSLDGSNSALLGSKHLSAWPAVGGWLAYDNMVFLRYGARQFQMVEEFRGHKTFILTPTAGLGVRAFGFSLDYALAMPTTGISIHPSHMFTLAYSWGTEKS